MYRTETLWLESAGGYGKGPANAGDLAALVLDTLQDMKNRIRNGNTDDYKQYWNEERSGQSAYPKIEDHCRDTLLSDLQQRLGGLNIEAQPEGHFAEDKRSDIRISAGGANGFVMPIEIKKDSHQELWKSMHDQLIRRYTRDHRADGFGIYLVFWFGAGGVTASPCGNRPECADELAQLLRNTLSEGEKRKISICVIDVALPDRGL